MSIEPVDELMYRSHRIEVYKITIDNEELEFFHACVPGPAYYFTKDIESAHRDIDSWWDS